jgi:hypothetical protein
VYEKEEILVWCRLACIKELNVRNYVKELDKQGKSYWPDQGNGL